jgi:hypothetical protein
MKKIQEASEQGFSVIPVAITGVFAAIPPDTRSKHLSEKWISEKEPQINTDEHRWI